MKLCQTKSNIEHSINTKMEMTLQKRPKDAKLYCQVGSNAPLCMHHTSQEEMN